jgi:hypothetical protein
MRRSQDRALSTTSSQHNVSASTLQLLSQHRVTDSLPELSPISAEVNNLDVNQFTQVYIPHEDSNTAVEQNTQTFPAPSDWDFQFQDLFVDGSQPDIEFLASDIDWQHIGSMELLPSTISDSGQSPTVALARDRSGNDYSIPLPPSIVDHL